MTEHTLDILYRDDDLLILNKPAGLLTVPGKGPDNQWRRVKLTDRSRGGYMTMAGPLTVTSLAGSIMDSGYTGAAAELKGTGFEGYGGTIELVNNSGRLMDRVSYGTEDEWPVAPDGSTPGTTQSCLRRSRACRVPARPARPAWHRGSPAGGRGRRCAGRPSR